MREIKFRAWDGERMITWDAAESFNDNDYYRAMDCDSGLMQFTGLADERGIDIYEGDIVLITEDDEDSCMGREFNYRGEVVYGNGGKCLYASEYPVAFCVLCDDFYRGQKLLGISRMSYEIIGNIYENPEMIKTPDSNN